MIIVVSKICQICLSKNYTTELNFIQSLTYFFRDITSQKKTRAEISVVFPPLEIFVQFLMIHKTEINLEYYALSEKLLQLIILFSLLEGKMQQRKFCLSFVQIKKGKCLAKKISRITKIVLTCCLL
jgi:hypothetical protein